MVHTYIKLYYTQIRSMYEWTSQKTNTCKDARAYKRRHVHVYGESTFFFSFFISISLFVIIFLNSTCVVGSIFLLKNVYYYIYWIRTNE